LKRIQVSRNKFKDKKHTQLLYETYVLTFPDGDVWMKQEPFSAHDMAFKLNQMISEHKAGRLGYEWKLRAEALWKAGECWWKDEAGIEHLIIIEPNKRPKAQLKKYEWGRSKVGMADFKTETKDVA
jgi:hypothetical protein